MRNMQKVNTYQCQKHEVEAMMYTGDNIDELCMFMIGKPYSEVRNSFEPQDDQPQKIMFIVQNSYDITVHQWTWVLKDIKTKEFHLMSSTTMDWLFREYESKRLDEIYNNQDAAILEEPK